MKVFVIFVACFAIASAQVLYTDDELYGNPEYSDFCIQDTGADAEQITYLRNSEVTMVDIKGACYAICMLAKQGKIYDPKMKSNFQSTLREYKGFVYIQLDVDNVTDAYRYVKKCKETDTEDFEKFNEV